MKQRFFFLALVIATSCTSRQDVHIFNQGYEDAELDAVVAALREAGFRPRPNELEVPEGIHRSSIIYPPIVEDVQSLDQLRDSLAPLGIPEPELIYETRGEHFYSTENIGLYLVNPDYVAPVAEPTQQELGPMLSHIYYSNCADVEAELSLFGESAAVLELVEWNERTQREHSTLFDGQWHATDSTILFELFDAGTMLFEFSEFDGRDNYGRFYGIDLVNTQNDSELATCDFRFITYDARTTLNRI